MNENGLHATQAMLDVLAKLLPEGTRFQTRMPMTDSYFSWVWMRGERREY